MCGIDKLNFSLCFLYFEVIIKSLLVELAICLEFHIPLCYNLGKKFIRNLIKVACFLLLC